MSEPAKILVVVTAGGKSNAAPLLEIARILHSRNHVIELGVLAGNEGWASECGFIAGTHTLGPGIPEEIEEPEYLSMSQWQNGRYTTNYEAMYRSRRFMARSWPDVYKSLSAIVENESTRPDILLADYAVDAVRDMNIQFGIPIVTHWPQMPTSMLYTSYIPGIPGLQFEILTSENATVWQRLLNDLLPLRMLGVEMRHRKWQREMRSTSGVSWRLPRMNKPNHLLLVNSFFGMEVPKDLPPLVAPVGPILSDTLPPLDPVLGAFLETHPRTLYISLGTHVLFNHEVVYRILTGVAEALNEKVFDGVIWAMRGLARKQLDLNASLPSELGLPKATIGDLFDSAHPDFIMVPFAPQRTILEHPHTRVFLSHCGPASANEAAYHGVPVVGIGVYFDQLQCALRLREAGIAIILEKDAFSAQDVCAALQAVMQDKEGSFKSNSVRLQRIARIASRRKLLAADLIEEVLVHAQAARISPDLGRPLHLETADTRMPRWKASGLDLKCIKLIFLGLLSGSAYLLIRSL